MVKYVWLDEACKPFKGSDGAAAVDLRIAQDLVVYPGQVVLAGLGVKVELPKEMGLLILPRSGTNFKLFNTVGLIDSDYRGEIKAKIENPGREAIVFNKGDRIVQAIVINVATTSWVAVQALSETNRNESGFGSTGVN